MLFVFKSKAAADVTMFGDVAKNLIGILGKETAEPKGIVTVEQLPDAIRRLRAAIDEDKARGADANDDKNKDEDAGAERSGMAAPVSLAQRAWPLLEMLELSQKEGVPVVWGV